jgi:hypothetical protein
MKLARQRLKLPSVVLQHRTDSSPQLRVTSDVAVVPNTSYHSNSCDSSPALTLSLAQTVPPGLNAILGDLNTFQDRHAVQVSFV